jgi:outer membrane protein assembly factor BamB
MKHRPEKMPPDRPDIRIPNIMVVDKHTGKLIAMDDQAIPEVFHGQWSSLASGVVEGRRLVFWGDGYGILHAYATDGFESGEDGIGRLKELWTFDANPHSYRFHPDGTRRLYPVTMEKNLELRKFGPAHMISTPVFHEGKVYVALGRDRNYADKSRGRGDGPGAISCVDASEPTNADKDRLVWRNTDVGRFHATPAIVDGRMYLAGTDGLLYCMRIDDGQVVWSYDLGRGVCDRSSIVADGKIYVSNDSGETFVFATGDEAKLLFQKRFRDAPSTPIVSGELLILANKREITVYKKGAGPARVHSFQDEEDE